MEREKTSREIIEEAEAEGREKRVSQNSRMPIECLTKREFIAVQIMAGFAAKGYLPDQAADIAVKWAEAILLRFDKRST